MSATREPEIPACPCGVPGATHRVSEHWVKAEPTKGPLTLARDDSPAMTAPEPTPTAERIDAVARLVWATSRADESTISAIGADLAATAILTSTDPAVHAALLDALVRAGVLTPERHCAHARAAQADGDYRPYTCEDAGTHCPPPRLVTRWEVAP